MRSVIVEVEGFQGEDSSIIVVRDGEEPRPDTHVYCIGVLDGDVVRLVDWGYLSEEDARQVLRKEHEHESR